jgi:DNA (cytosine-5)-methyltransferase 1
MIASNQITPARQIYAVDLFCGAGGLTRGLLDAGIRVRAGVDLDPICEYPYEQNNNAAFLKKSVADLSPNDIKLFYRKRSLRLLAGCAPCQTFSTYNLKARSAEDKDKRWFLLLEFARLVNEISPELVTMENVPGLAEQDVFEEFVQTLRNNGYHVSSQVVACAEYGIPQHRHRLVLLASKLGEIKLLTPEAFGKKRKTVIDVLKTLPPLKAGEKSKTDPLHQCSRLSSLNLKRIRVSKPGGSWRDWPKELVADCHQKKSGESYGSVYGRMKWNEPAPTMTTQFFGFGNGRFGHPEQDRAISLREGAIIQSFPPDYQFVKPDEPVCQKNIGRLIGNAVPVKLGEVIGKSIVAHVNKIYRKTKRC